MVSSSRRCSLLLPTNHRHSRGALSRHPETTASDGMGQRLVASQSRVIHDFESRNLGHILRIASGLPSARIGSSRTPGSSRQRVARLRVATDAVAPRGSAGRAYRHEGGRPLGARPDEGKGADIAIIGAAGESAVSNQHSPLAWSRRAVATRASHRAGPLRAGPSACPQLWLALPPVKPMSRFA
jgi:hypothetical protein